LTYNSTDLTIKPASVEIVTELFVIVNNIIEFQRTE